jgi:hypothetical protein
MKDMEVEVDSKWILTTPSIGKKSRTNNNQEGMLYRFISHNQGAHMGN